MTQWKLVQVEPTPEMIDAWNNDDSDEFRHAYRAMLEAAPQPPEVEPVAKVTGYYGGHLSISTIDGRVLPAGTALYLAPPAPEPVPVAWRYEDAFGTHFTEDYSEISNIPGVLSFTALFSDQPRQSEHTLEMVNTPAPSAPDMPLSMEQFGGLVGLARDDASEKAIVYKATNIYGETCYFGVKSTAQAWAKSGRVDEVRLRDLRLVATPTPPEPTADLVRDAKPDIWRVMCGDWRDKTVAIHNSAGYITCGLDPAKAAALVRAHNGEMSDGAAAIAEVKGQS